jgi:ubiquinone/menaquinone biosynthesis C-methylase UbiE
MDYARWKRTFGGDGECDFDQKYYRGLRGALKLWGARRLVRRALASLQAGGALLEVPCGSGRLLAECARGGRPVVGADISRGLLRRAAGFPRVRCDVERLPFRDRAFGAVVSVRLMHRLEPRRQEAVLRELGRVASGAVVAQFKRAGTLKHAWARLWGRRPRAGRLTRREIEARAVAARLAWGGAVALPAGLSEDVLAVYRRP